MISHNYIPFIVQHDNNENAVLSGTESDSGNSEDNEYKYLDANEFYNVVFTTDRDKAFSSQNISTLNIVLTNSHAQKYHMILNCEMKNSLSNELSNDNILNESKTEIVLSIA